MNLLKLGHTVLVTGSNVPERPYVLFAALFGRNDIGAGCIAGSSPNFVGRLSTRATTIYNSYSNHNINIALKMNRKICLGRSFVSFSIYIKIKMIKIKMT